MTLNLQKFPESHSTALPCTNGNHRSGSYNRVHSRTMIDYWITSRSLETFFGSFSMKFFCALLPSQFFVLFCWRLFLCPHSKDSPVQEIENQFSKLNWKIVAERKVFPFRETKLKVYSGENLIIIIVAKYPPGNRNENLFREFIFMFFASLCCSF